MPTYNIQSKDAKLTVIAPNRVKALEGLAKHMGWRIVPNPRKKRHRRNGNGFHVQIPVEAGV